jgi:Zn finger protein HypA/HybF involved in hydrogenase expression
MATEKRLIDANEIEELFYKQVEYGATDLMDAFDDALQDAQTVDAVEVVHGRWAFRTANHREYMKCSECLHSYTPDGTFCYCPNCGADMRERKDNEP